MDYIKTGIPLYGAAIKGDWKTAKEIFDKRPEIQCFMLLHQRKNIKQVEEFVEHLLTYMEHKDLELKNNTSNTALCLAAITGNLKMIKMMVKKNRALVAITGCQGMTPLYMAALFGNYEVLKYLYDNSEKLRDKCWTPQNRGWLILKCVETNLFDIAVEIVKEHPELGSISEKPRNEIDAILGGPPDPPVKLDDKPPFDQEDQTLELPK